jgi:hypothetical protein
MRASRPPWWLYFIAASFVGYLTLQIYNYIGGPASIDFDADYSTGKEADHSHEHYKAECACLHTVWRFHLKFPSCF